MYMYTNTETQFILVKTNTLNLLKFKNCLIYMFIFLDISKKFSFFFLTKQSIVVKTIALQRNVCRQLGLITCHRNSADKHGVEITFFFPNITA